MQDWKKWYLILILPTLFWLSFVQKTEILTAPPWQKLLYLLKHTYEKPLLLFAVISGFILSVLLIYVTNSFSQKDFECAAFKNFLRGIKIVSRNKLKNIIKQKYEQVANL